MCGNGARCFGRFASQLLLQESDTVTFETIAGELTANLKGEDVEVAMSNPFDLEPEIRVEVEGLSSPIHSVNTGVPHAVSYVENLADLDVVKLGAAIRYHDHFFPRRHQRQFCTSPLAGPHRHSHLRARSGRRDSGLRNRNGRLRPLPPPSHRSPLSHCKVDVRGGETLAIGFEKSGDDFRQCHPHRTCGGDIHGGT